MFAPPSWHDSRAFSASHRRRDCGRNRANHKGRAPAQCQARWFLMAIARHDKGQRVHQMFGYARPMTAFAQTFAYQPHLAIGKWQAAMHQFGRTGRGRTKITLSMTATRSPRKDASKAMAAPVAPPPIMARSKVSEPRASIALHNVFKTGLLGRNYGQYKARNGEGARKWLSQTPMG